MTNKNYGRGRALEYRMKDKLEKQGYFVVRAAGSHGVADLVAINRVRIWGEVFPAILFISCKITEYAPPDERAKLQEAAAKYGAIPMITVRDESNEWTLRKLE